MPQYLREMSLNEIGIRATEMRFSSLGMLHCIGKWKSNVIAKPPMDRSGFEKKEKRGFLGNNGSV